MLKQKWYQNFAKPGVSLGGKLALKRMNKSHQTLLNFGSEFYQVPHNGNIIDIGCGGGYNLAQLRAKSKNAMVYGVDYSPLSVKQSMRFNKKSLATGSMNILNGNVNELCFRDNFFNLVTACETIYFWDDLAANFKEIYRVMAHEGTLVILCSSVDKIASQKYIDMIHKMRVYSADELSNLLSAANFKDININMSALGEACITAKK